jgi:asparagine synthase (glutamine-hydrolysing)
MCGICGAIDWSESPNAVGLVRRMTPTMLQRGPDDEGYLDREALSLGMRRLSIIDVAGGHQPVFNQDGSVGAILNGEIYNFQELQEQLKDRGHTFRTRSDSEVVAHAYEEWGAQCVERFQGMFAIAVYDGRKPQQSAISSQHSANRAALDEAGGTLFLARDRLGIKPLYYSAISNERSAISKFLFASEVRTLLASDVVPRKLSRDGVESYLLFGSVSEPMTLVEGVYSLPPGHRMTVQLNNSSQAIKAERYWDIARVASSSVHPSLNGEKTSETAAKQVRALLEESVRKHLIADVPVGVFLSSGIDSTALAGLASRAASGVHTFTVGFPEAEYSETTIARRTAAKFGTTHQEVMLTGDEMLAHLGEAVGALDQPSIDGINTYFVSKSARQAGLKVALSGLGGDEVFGGYSSFSRTAKYQRMASVSAGFPAGVRSVMASAGRQILSGDAGTKLAALIGSPASLPDPYYFGRALFPPDSVAGLMAGEKRNGHKPLWWNWLAESAASVRQLDAFAAVSCLEANSYLVNTLLRDTDSMSMAHSLEVRVPFLDHPLVEFVTQLPQKSKLNKGVPKALLVAALRDILPDEVVNQTKRGFTFPWAEWLRGPMRSSLEQGFSDMSPALRGVLNVEAGREVWRNYLAGKTSWSRPWSLYVLNEWTKNHL